MIQEKPHSIFSRQGNDLVHKRFESFIRRVWRPVDVASGRNVSLKDALVGFEFTIRGIDGVVERIS